MYLPVYIAKRYLVSKKKHNAINIISIISVCGISLATLAMVCTLSVMNGFTDTVATLFTSFDPELKVLPLKGKTFDAQDERILALYQMPEIEVVTQTLEEQAMVEYKGRQMMAIIKGVDDNFQQATDISKVLHGAGQFMLHDELVDYAVMGIELVPTLGTGIHFVEPLAVYAPKRNTKVNMANPGASFKREYLFSPGCVFVVNQQKYDSQYILTSLNFARRIFDYETEVSAIELKLREGENTDSVKRKLSKTLSSDFRILDRYEQQEEVFKIMEIEKLMSYLFLTFILMIACFNVIGSLSMLIIDKKDDVLTLKKLGANNKLISRIFLYEGWMIAVSGALLGVVVGLALCLIQQEFGLIKLGGSGAIFIMDAFPVSVRWTDILYVFLTVTLMGLLSVWYPVRYLSKRILT